MNGGKSICGVLALALTMSGAIGQVPYKTRKDIVSYAATGIGSNYVWGGGNWDPDDRSFGGADCSGFVSKCWSISRWSPYRYNLHGPSTAGYIQTPGSSWDEVDRADLLYGDAICYRSDGNTSGHTYIYLAGDGWGDHEVYEARGTAYGIVHRWRTVYSGAEVTKGLRNTLLIENVDVTEHIVEVDDGTPFYTDDGMNGSSAYDSHALGCREGDCRYRWVTADRTQTCTFRPVLPEAGWYRIYVTCDEDSPNVSDVGVTVNHAYGSDRFLWDQADATALNTWVPVGDQSYYFDAGSGGTVVWDDFEAWPTDGTCVFRGDATKFVLDNRVEVDGSGAAPGNFATIRDAIAWLASHGSEEPDLISITTDLVFESGCIELALLDDVTIDGDADENGVPVTVVVSPSVPADWSSSCGMYLDIPIQHHYAIRDLVLVPYYLGAGYGTGAYGLVIDEQNPAGDACAWTLELENIAVAGSLPGHVATDPGVDTRASATMFGHTNGSYGAAVLQRTSDWAGDDACRQTVTASNLTITHSATRGLALRGAYTDWTIDGGLQLTLCGQEAIRGDGLDDSTLTIQRSVSNGANLIADNLGHALVNQGSGGEARVEIGACVIRGNGGNQGGAIYSSGATTALRNCWVIGNAAGGFGGAAYVIGGTLTVQKCTIADNSAGNVGGIYATNAVLSVNNSIVWGNSGTQLAGATEVTHSDVESGHPGTSNIDAQPRFIDALAGDYHLRRGSPCVNAADPAFAPHAGEADIDGEPCVQAGFADMGADEIDFWAGDADRDGDVNAYDWFILADCLAGPEMTPTPPPPMSLADCLITFDYDDDGDVDLADSADFHFRDSDAVVMSEIIVDNADAEFSILLGSWSTGAYGTPHGADYNWASATSGSATAEAEWRPSLPQAGEYQVSIWYVQGSNRTDNAPFTVHHAGGTDTVLVNQQVNGETWFVLGTYSFAADAGGYVTVSNDANESVVIADAVKFSRIE